MKYSIVTPIYNSFASMQYYFETLKHIPIDVEILLVDDCSTDNTFDQLCEYQKTSNLNIHVLRTPSNGGPGVARNVGMHHAHGDWIVFLDSDDSLQRGFFEKLDALIMERNPDCIIYDSELYDQHNRLLPKVKKSVYGKKEGFLSVTDAIAFAIPGVRKCFKRELLQNGRITFSNLRRGEDFLFYTMLFSSNPQMVIYYTEQKLYQIHQREGSLSRNTRSDNIMPAIFDYLLTNVAEEYSGAIEIASVRLYLYGGLLILLSNGTSGKAVRSYINEYEKAYPKWYGSIGMTVLGKNKVIFLVLAKCRFVPLMRVYVALHKFLTTR